MAQQVYFNVLGLDGEELSGKIEDCYHLGLRTLREGDLDRTFVLERLGTLMRNAHFADAIINGIRIGERAIIDDLPMGYKLVVAHNLEDSLDSVEIITIKYNLRVGDGQDVLRVFKDGFKHCIWKAASRVYEEVAV